MNEVYILMITKETTDQHPEAQAFAYGDMDSALNAYSVAVDEARTESEDYEFAHEDSEIVTDTYRYFRIEDLNSNDAITIVLQAQELIGGECYIDTL